ncbi:hypothetical protein BRE01_58910 [Brevibacillus reuszeri]|uniref:Uncharacterized protein n=1 Tax=Brevibacillus reuszeri TaxID=54915 RepID=A0A0K9YVH6_9BACL|nr:hypothetical protein [Brevibacillus reuszeri]KNB72210.1 hypothetical protein ADS79_09840 [Brevibacillus reuszeri]MED1855845.1 hypothetical protein [Brevibacillus reuszeri]GED72189.1 hypothetical protein BRE01_58910 [Brevibacillus reuszeri]
MLQLMVERLGEHLAAHGMITDILLRSDRSLVADEESQEVILSFSIAEDENVPEASVHLFSLQDEGSCEVEVEVTFPGEWSNEQSSRLWEQAKAMIPEISLTEKRRYLEPGKIAEAAMMLDYHFVVEQPAAEDEEKQFETLLEKFSADLGVLVRLTK